MTTSVVVDGASQSNIGLSVENELASKSELNRLLPSSHCLESSKNLSSSAPGAISNQECSLIPEQQQQHINQSCSDNDLNEELQPLQPTTNDIELQHRQSKDSAMEDENCRSLSCLTDSTEQSAPVNFDMSNRVSLYFVIFFLLLDALKKSKK